MNDKIYYSVKMKHKKLKIVIQIDCFEIDRRRLITSEIMKLIPKELRKDDWSMDINQILKMW